MEETVIDLLVCPGCRGDLRWAAVKRDSGRVVWADVSCAGCPAGYAVRDGIGGFLPPEPPEPDAVARDLWAEAAGFFARIEHDDPRLAARLLDAPLADLGPADQYFRAMVLEEQGRFAEAAQAITLAWPGLYTPEMLAAAEWALTEVVRHAEAASAAALVDLACGRGYLLERLARSAYTGILIGTDVSPRVLRRDQRWLDHLGLGSRVTLLAVDARHMPFRDGGVPLVTTHLGLDNLSPADAVTVMLGECARISGGSFVATCQAEVDAGLLRWPPVAGGESAEEHPALALYAAAGLHARLAGSRRAFARPTPCGEILGARVDAFPDHLCEIDWSIITA